ncbi:hypothetical protein [Klebsiella pneumoniae]|uniref:hypothetical protein n=1 Tax=Klebsiella pneumoniae TaxID=573 RepID=UPI00375138B3
MERQQEIEELKKKKERQELKRFDQQFGFLIVLLFNCVNWVFFLCSILKILAICSPLLQNNCKVLFIMTPCAGEALRLAIQTNTCALRQRH